MVLNERMMRCHTMLRYACGALVVVAVGSCGAAHLGAKSVDHDALSSIGLTGDRLAGERNAGTWALADRWRASRLEAVGQEDGAAICVACHRCNAFDAHPATPFNSGKLYKLREALRQLDCNQRQRFEDDNQVASLH
jgi:hypothetical protein